MGHVWHIIPAGLVFQRMSGDTPMRCAVCHLPANLNTKSYSLTVFYLVTALLSCIYTYIEDTYNTDATTSIYIDVMIRITCTYSVTISTVHFNQQQYIYIINNAYLVPTYLHIVVCYELAKLNRAFIIIWRVYKIRNRL